VPASTDSSCGFCSDAEPCTTASRIGVSLPGSQVSSQRSTRGPRPPLHVLDAATWEAMQALAGTGLLTLHARVTRPLLERAVTGADGPPPLTPEQQARINALNASGQRKQRVAQALLAAELVDEAMAPLREALLAHAQAEAIRRHLPEPTTLEDALRPPLDRIWASEVTDPLRQLATAAGPVESSRAHALLATLPAPSGKAL
jgi:hypothetical protein